MIKAVFLDRDGTINVDYGYVHDIDKLNFEESVVESLKRLVDNGFKLFIVTNQSGVGRGYFSFDDYLIFETELEKRLREKGALITDTRVCPHLEEDNCTCRKPKLGMYEDLISKYDIDLDNSYAIGDKERDLEICNKYPVCGILYSEKKVSKYNSFNSWEKIVDFILDK